MLDFYDYIVNYLSSDEFQRSLLWVKLFSAIICSFLLFAIVVLLNRSKANWLINEGVSSFRNVNLPIRLEKKWQQIQDRLEKSDEANLKLAVIEADNFMDDVLKRMALEGKDMGERLEKLTTQQLKSLDDIWDAHRLRNLIVHQTNVSINQNQAKKAIESFEKALKELEVI